MIPILFDLDGTLVDSAPDLHGAAAHMSTEAGCAPLDERTIRSFIGNGVPVLVQRIMAATGLDPADHARHLGVFSAYYAEHATDLTRPYPGVERLLDRLTAAGHPMAMVTNKPEAPARTILDTLGLSRHFRTVIGGDSLTTRKPDPAMLHLACDRLGGAGAMVGDSEVDAQSAANAGLPFALYTEGYRKTPAEQIPAGFRFDDFETLPAWIASLAPQRRTG